MLRTPAPLTSALYVSGLKVREGWLAGQSESPRCSPVSLHLFARVLEAGRALGSDGPAIQASYSLLICEHARPCKPKLSQLGGQAPYSATSVPWRTSREFCHRESPSVTEKLATPLFFAQPVSERARSKSSMNQTHRAPYNQLVEGTPP